MVASEILIEAIKGFEGLECTAYRCPGGVWTIGYGHTRNVREGMVITKEEALAYLRDDLVEYEDYVNSLGLDLTQGQFDALVDFAFNCGTGSLGSSTLLRKIRNGSTDDEVCGELMRWVHSNGRELRGLVLRRQWECERWRSSQD